MTHFTYIADHLLPTWLSTWSYNFKVWADLLTNNYDRYVLLEEDDPYQECYEWFWASINIDDILSKEFLEELYQMIDDIDTGIVKTVPAEDVFQKMKEIVDDMEDEK